MIRFIVKRVIAAIVTVFLIASLTFFLMNQLPGGPFANEKLPQKTIEAMNKAYGLDKPIGEQYLIYMGKLVKGDLGLSLKRLGFTVNEIIAEKFPVSAKIGGIALVLSIGVGIPLGAIAAIKRNTIIDRIVMLFSTFGIAVPGFVFATVSMYVFGVYLKWLPTGGIKTPAGFVLPAIALSLYPACYIARLMRSSMLDVLGQDYIRTAKAKGLSDFIVVFKHAMRNSIIPVVTYIGPLTATILTGGFVVEKIFTIPGLGRFFIESITGRDYSMIMGTTVFLAALIVFANLIVDVLYGIIDPRIRLE